MRERLQFYYQLTKPGIIRGNLLTAAAGYALAAHGQVNILSLLATLAGLSLIIACGCVLNNYMDRGIDARMQRTKTRALANGRISGRSAIIYSTVLGLSGSVILAIYVNFAATVTALFGLLAYVVIYGYAKRRGSYGTLIGSISGAMPPLVGYLGAGGHQLATAVALCAVLVCWQMPHFYAIAIFRRHDYAAAGIPVLPVVSGLARTKSHITMYIIAFGVVSTGLAVVSPAGLLYAVSAFVLSIVWLRYALPGYRTTTPAYNEHWARQLFGVSLLIILLLCAAIAVDSFV